MSCPHCPAPDGCLAWPQFCAWAAEDPPDPVKLAHIRNRSLMATDPAAYPALATQAVGLGRALWDWAMSGFTMASKAEVERRLAICGECSNWNAESRRCLICGCYTDAKIHIKTEKCPLDPPKW